jgi:hypothetical protein
MWDRAGGCEFDRDRVVIPGRELAVAEVPSAGIDVAAIRARFSSLRQGFAFLDAPGGTQVPDEVGDAIARALREASANLGAGYATSVRVGQILEEAEAKAARFLGCEPREVTFGANMTSLNFALSRTAAREFSPGDEILVSCLDHDAGVAPWLEIAHAWPARRSGSGRTIRGTRSAYTRAWATPASRSASASSTTTPSRRSTGCSRPWTPCANPSPRL